MATGAVFFCYCVLGPWLLVFSSEHIWQVRSKIKIWCSWTFGRWDQKWISTAYSPFLHHRLQRHEIGCCLSCRLQTVWLWCGEVGILLLFLLTTNWAFSCLSCRLQIAWLRCGEVSVLLPFLLTTNCTVMVWRDECTAAVPPDYKLYGYGVEGWVSCLSCWLQIVWSWGGEESVLLTTNCMVMGWRGECTADYKLYGCGVERWVYCWL